MGNRACPANVAGSTKHVGGTRLIATLDPMQVLASLQEEDNTFSEDCLTLNIWTKPQTGEKSKAVLFWLFGGGTGPYPVQKVS